jgi:Flp pilus assembly protein TadG
MNTARQLLKSNSGATAAEFALVLPLLLLLIFGIIDAGRYMWEFNRAEKATQMGVRYAVVTDPVLGSGFSDYSFAISDGITAGSTIPAANFDSATCTQGSCSCAGGTVCGSVAYDGTAFQKIVDRMSAMYPQIGPANVEVDYKNVGLGFAGDPDGPDVSPLVTVRIRGDNPLVFQPVTCMIFACSISMPNFTASLTGEDLVGTQSN